MPLEHATCQARATFRNVKYQRYPRVTPATLAQLCQTADPGVSAGPLTNLAPIGKQMPGEWRLTMRSTSPVSRRTWHAASISNPQSSQTLSVGISASAASTRAAPARAPSHRGAAVTGRRGQTCARAEDRVRCCRAYRTARGLFAHCLRPRVRADVHASHPERRRGGRGRRVNGPWRRPGGGRHVFGARIRGSKASALSSTNERSARQVPGYFSEPLRGDALAGVGIGERTRQ